MELKNRFPGKEADDTEETINRVIPEANKDYSESGEEGPGIRSHRFWRRFRYMCGYWQSNGHRIRSRIARTFCPCTLRSEGNARWGCWSSGWWSHGSILSVNGGINQKDGGINLWFMFRTGRDSFSPLNFTKSSKTVVISFWAAAFCSVLPRFGRVPPTP